MDAPEPQAETPRTAPGLRRTTRGMPGLAILLLVLLAGIGRSAGIPGASAEESPPAVPIAESLRPVDPWLRNADWTVRSMAVLELRGHAKPGVVFFASRMLAGEKHPFAAACALKALLGRSRLDLVMEGGTGLVDALFRFAAHEHPIVRARARALLQVIPPVKLGTKFEHYPGWWSRGRMALRMEQASILKRMAAATPKAPPKSGGTVASPSKEGDLYKHLERIRTRGLELCIVMDHTGSMAPVIGAAKGRAVALVKRLSAFLPHFRAGLVTYDDAARLRMTLTHNAASLLKAFNKVGAGGGGDFEEGVDKGVRLALKQELMGWSRGAQRVIVVVGDAPPHDGDVARLLRDVLKARSDEMYDLPLILHTVSTHSQGVEYFPQIAQVGGGAHITLRQTSRLVDELILLSFGGGAHRVRVARWIEEIEALMKAAK